MLHSSSSSGARWLVLALAVASSWGAAREAHAAGGGRFGLAPVQRLYPSSPANREAPAKPFPGDTASQCGVVTYCGGPVISSVNAVPVYWTSGVSSTITSWAPGYLKALTGSAFMDMLSEYSTAGKTGEACGMQTDAGLEYFGPATPSSTNQTITRGTALSAVTITPTTTTGTSIADDNAAIGAELAAQIAAGKLPAPTYDAQGYPNTIYIVFFPQSYGITLQGMGSCSAFGGYHYSAPFAAQASCKGQYLPYAVIPDCGGGTGELEVVVSHELAEAVTDTDVGPTTPMSANYGDGAWYLGPTSTCTDPNSCPTCGEVGDVCDSQGAAMVPNTSINAQNVWSQTQNNNSGTCTVDNPSTGAQPAGPSTMGCGTAPVTDAGAPGADASAGDAGTSSDSGSGNPSGDDGGGSSSGGGPSGGSSGGGADGGGSGSSSGGAGGNNFDSSSSNSGCACSTPQTGTRDGAGALAGLLVLALLARARGKRRSG